MALLELVVFQHLLSVIILCVKAVGA